MGVHSFSTHPLLRIGLHPPNLKLQYQFLSEVWRSLPMIYLGYAAPLWRSGRRGQRS
ncbi:hypothetical protein AB205_0126220 [Aquarana catesbeiana]|uniref:Uncharacterized protein n=1 Tax=Aquarana catesbeiana TaxID=8400 RepID=A0A2G9SKC2_AQUCT|nr:hypothetical protein AB205_0126220 [Aquarana catesbeiana]